jgi:putative ABC transport system permease protein
VLGKLSYKTPLAWLQLTKQKSRFVVALAGIAFADLLMFIQMAFQDALFDAAMLPHRALQADLVLTDPRLQTLFAVEDFSRERLHQALSNPHVASVSPVYVSTAQWRNPETRQNRNILVWGIDPARPAFRFPEVNQNLNRLKQLHQVLFDQAGRPEYGPIADLFKKQGVVDIEVSGTAIQVAGLFTLGASFAADGNVITSDSTFMQIFPGQKPERVQIGLIKLKPGAVVEEVRSQLAATLPNDVRVLSAEGFAQVEKKYWEAGTGIGFIFGIGVIMGFFVGIVVVYQILYSDVTDHLPEYATLKAMGYTDGYLMGVLMQEALILAVLGYIPGFVFATALYQLTYSATLLPIGMTTARAINVFILTVVMCFVSGAIAMRKLQAADPADIF